MAESGSIYALEKNVDHSYNMYNLLAPLSAFFAGDKNLYEGRGDLVWLDGCCGGM